MRIASQKGDLRRGTRLMLTIPIVIRGTDAKGNAFCDRTRTFSINQYGGLLETERELGVGECVLIENPALGQIAPAKVIHLETKQGGAAFRVAVELTEPQNIWGIEFPPSDWKSAPRRAEPTGPHPPSQTAGATADQAVILFTKPPKDTGQSGPRTIALPPSHGAEAAAVRRGIPESRPITLPEPAAQQDFPALEGIRAAAHEAITAFAKQLEEMVQVAGSNWHAEMEKLGEQMRRAFREDMERWFRACLEAAAVQLRKQIENEVTPGRQRLEDFNRQITEGALQSVRGKVAAMLAALDEPNRAQAAAGSVEMRPEAPED
jgi:hypothetical protein